MKTKKVFISGKITGDPDYRKKFEEAEEELRAMGYTLIMNPAVLPFGFEWDEYMKITMAMLDACDTVYFLKGWEKSQGAKLEALVAKTRKYTTLYQKSPRNPKIGAESTK